MAFDVAGELGGHARFTDGDDPIDTVLFLYKHGPRGFPELADLEEIDPPTKGGRA